VTYHDYERWIRAAYPEIKIASLRSISGHGQNNIVLVVNEALVFRFPRHADGVERLQKESAILRAIRPHVSLATPDPMYAQLDPSEAGQAFIGYPMIPGEALWQQTLDAIADEGALAAMGRQAGAFLKQLHAVPVAEIPLDDVATFDTAAEWKDMYRRIEAELFPQMRPDARAQTRQHFDVFLSDRQDRDIRPVLIHGDFGTVNILYDPVTWTITGVIDFSGAGVGDPAVDFAALPLSPPAFHEGALRAYPEITSAPERVEFYRGTFPLQEALFGIDHGDDQAFRRGMEAYI